MDDRLTENIFRDTLYQVERDEAEAIDVLCVVLEKVEESRDFSCLSQVRSVMKEWQNRSPRGIVEDLTKVAEGLKTSVQG